MDVAEIIAVIAGGGADIVTKYPMIATVLMAMGFLRAIMKPLFSLARAVVTATESKSDDAALDKVEASTAVKWLSYALDYVASIKVGPQANPEKAK